jgi:hypothetical protein
MAVLTGPASMSSSLSDVGDGTEFNGDDLDTEAAHLAAHLLRGDV